MPVFGPLQDSQDRHRQVLLLSGDINEVSEYITVKIKATSGTYLGGGGEELYRIISTQC